MRNELRNKEIIDKYESGAKIADIAATMNLKVSTVKGVLYTHHSANRKPRWKEGEKGKKRTQRARQSKRYRERRKLDR